MTGDSVTLQIREVLATAKHLDAQRVVLLLRFDQRDRWMRNQSVPAELYLRELESAGIGQHGFDLIYNEFLVREELGQNPSFDEFGRRFPNFRAQLEEQVKLHRSLGSLVKPALAATIDTPAPQATLPAEKIDIPGYQIIRKIGKGGMGVVYKAKQLSPSRLVAIKTIEAARQQPAALQRFQREAQAAAKLDHPNIVKTFDHGQAGDLHYIAMEYVEGFDLDRLVEGWGKLPITLACECMLQAARGLQHAHERGLVHRDIKPSNLILTTEVGTRSWAEETIPPYEFWSTRNFVVKLIDMGLARNVSPGSDASVATHAGDLIGTPEFIAPEQLVDARAVDIRADLYSLGCTFYFLLSGKVPFEGRNLMETLDKHRWAPPRLVKLMRPEVPMELAEIIRKLMAKRPEERYQTPAELETALRELMTKERALFEPAEQLRSKTEPGPALPPPSPAAAAPMASKSIPLPGSVVKPRLPDPAPLQPAAAAPAAGPGVAPSAVAAPGAPPSPARPGLGKFELLRNRAKIESPSWSGAAKPPTEPAAKPPAAVKAEGAPAAAPVVPAKPKSTLSDSDLLAKRRRMLDSGEMPAAIPGGGMGGLPPEPAKEPVLKSLATSIEAKTEAKEKAKDKDKSKPKKKPEELQAILADQIEKNDYLGARNTVVQLLEVSPKDEVALAAMEFLKDQSGECGQFNQHTDWVTCLAMAPSNKFFVSGGRDKTVRVWDLETRTQKHCFTNEGVVNAVTISADNKLVMCGDSQGFLRLWEVESGKEVRRFRGFDGEVYSLVIAGKYAVSGTKRAMNCIWEIETGRMARQLRGHKAEIICVAVAPGARALLSSSKDGTVRLWGGDKFREQKRIDLKVAQANSVTFAGESFAVLGTSDNVVSIWNMNDGKEARRMEGHSAPVNGVAIGGNNGRILSGSSDKTVRFWRVRSGKQICSFNGHTDEVLAVAMTSDAKFGISAGKDKSIRLWKLPEHVDEE